MPLSDFRSVVLPYCLKRMKDKTYIVLNREYKPIGFNTREHIKYENFILNHKVKGITNKIAEKLSCDGSDSLEVIYLYNDGSIPTSSVSKCESYFEKLKILLKLEIK